jgi:SAM-dependent methyltransferase
MKSSWPRSLERFKFDHELIESGVGNQSGSYQGLDPRALYTSREDFLALFSHELVSGTFVDLGCGTGEGCLLYGHLYPDRFAIGVDFETARISAGLKIKAELKLSQVKLLQQDLLHDPLPVGDTYFLYFPTGMVLDRILNELYQSHRFFRLIAIESHGDLFPRLSKENWLRTVAEIPLVSERHHPQARVFERQQGLRLESLLPHTLSFQEKYLVIQEDGYIWLGESLGLEWSLEERYELLTPPRSILWHQVKEVLSFDQIPVKYQQAIKLRRLGEVKIQTFSSDYQGFIRKIGMEPTFHLELSSGAKVEWSDIVTITQGSTICYASSSV